MKRKYMWMGIASLTLALVRQLLTPRGIMARCADFRDISSKHSS